jgi:hypothetical protein
MEVVRQTLKMNSRARCLLHGRNKIYLSRNRYSNTQHTTLRDEDTSRASLAKGRSSSTSKLQIFKLKFVRMFCITTTNICININTWLSLHPPTKHTSVIDSNPHVYLSSLQTLVKTLLVTVYGRMA